MESKNFQIIGLTGEPATGKTETLKALGRYFQEQGLNVIRVPYGEIVRSLVYGWIATNIATNEDRTEAKRPDFWQNLPPESLELVSQKIAIKEEGIYFAGIPLNGQLKREDITNPATYLGGNPSIPILVEEIIRRLPINSIDYLLLEGRKDAVSMMDICGWMSCSPLQQVEIYRLENPDLAQLDNGQIREILDRRIETERNQGLHFVPENATILRRLDGVSHQRVAQVFGNLIINARNNHSLLPSEIIIAADTAELICRR